MKYFSSASFGQIAIGFLFLLQITSIVCYIERGHNTIEITFESFLPENFFSDESCDITALYIKNNNFHTLPENIFVRQTNLLTLDLVWNNLSTLPENIFRKQVNLQSLDLSINTLTTLPENVFRNLTNLQKLRIAGNRLSTLPENIFKNQFNLRTLDLSSNSLNNLPDRIFENLTNLRTLNLRWNVLRTLPENIFEYQTKLQVLDLHGIMLTILSENIFQCLSNLQTLNLENNKLTTLPKNIFKSQVNLKMLDLNDNELFTLPKGIISDITRSPYLNILALNKNPWLCDCDFLEEIRPHINRFRFDEIVCVDAEQITDMLNRPIISMIFLESMDSNEYDQKYVNRICESLPTNETTVRVCPSECNCLISHDNSTVFFDCSNNNLKTVPSKLGNILRLLPYLMEIELNISSNDIVDLPNSSMQGFELITKIAANNNSINSVSVDNLPQKLIEIDLSENKLETLTIPFIEQLSNMKVLKRLELGGNTWICNYPFFHFVQFNKEKVDYENIVCKDGETMAQKHDRLFG